MQILNNCIYVHFLFTVLKVWKIKLFSLRGAGSICVELGIDSANFIREKVSKSWVCSSVFQVLALVLKF